MVGAAAKAVEAGGLVKRTSGAAVEEVGTIDLVVGQVETTPNLSRTQY
jgi:hypothetical protein